MQKGTILKKVILICIALSIPLFLSVQVWVVLRYQELKEQVSKLEAEQEEWLEKNKNLLSEISAYRSPQRLEQEATAKLGLSSLKPEQIMKIELSGNEQKNNNAARAAGQEASE
jgi:cell division protein FtsL